MKELAERYLHRFIYPIFPCITDIQKEIALNACMQMIASKNKRYVKLTPEKILKVLTRAGVKFSPNKTRIRPIVEDRQIVMYFLRKKTNLSFQEIGNFCGGFDHATVLYAVRAIENLRDTNKNYYLKINHLNEKL
jgi:chromosomal replication initiator protein